MIPDMKASGNRRVARAGGVGAADLRPGAARSGQRAVLTGSLIGTKAMPFFSTLGPVAPKPKRS